MTPFQLPTSFQRDEEHLNIGNITECNIETAGQAKYDDVDEEEFIVRALGAAEVQNLYKSVPYCQKWCQTSGLHLLKPELIKRAYAHNKEMGLFKLFLNGSYLNCMRAWTSKELVGRGKRSKPLRMDEILAYLGLELATSVHCLNRLKDYWCTSDLMGISFFKKVMGRDAFLNIRAALRTYADYDPDVATVDPLWHSRPILQHFARNAATLAVPIGVSSLDENTIRCKGRTAARSYMKSKPVKWGIRFYAVVGWAHAYLHSFQDNGSGNKTGQSPVQRYTTLFRNLRGAVERKIDGKLVSKSSSSALWCAQMAHQTQLHAAPDCGRLMVMDNFYTRPVLARQLHVLSDGDCKILGTVRFTNVDGINRPALKEAIEDLKHAPRGEWRLVQVFEKCQGATQTVEAAQNAGFIVFKDRCVVTLYTNDLLDTPTLRIHKPDDHAVHCVHGLAPLQRWTGDESLQRTTLLVPAVIVAYNLFMNSVDRFDQLRSTEATMRKERRVTMSILSFVLDAAIINSHALLHAISNPGEGIIDAMIMKRRIIQQLVMVHVEYKQTRASLSTALQGNQSDIIDVTESSKVQHLLLETNGRKSVHCLLCSLLPVQGRGRYTMYSCTKCERGFHVNCFTFFHNAENLRNYRPAVHNAILRAKAQLSSRNHRNRTNKVTSNLSTAKVIFKTQP